MSILITGASSGIGEALALYYAKQKQTLFICGRDQTRLNKVKTHCEQLGALVFAKILDVTDQKSVSKWIDECEAEHPLNLVIANAGVATLDETPENIFNTFNTNVNGVLNTVVPAAEIFKKRGRGQIAIMSSVAGYHGLPSCPSYSASKACVKAYGESIRVQLRPYGVKVSVICPGFVRSRITDKNTCPMPFFMETKKAAKIIGKKLKKDVGLITFPMPMRFAAWMISALPNVVSDFIYSRLPHKV